MSSFDDLLSSFGDGIGALFEDRLYSIDDFLDCGVCITTEDSLFLSVGDLEFISWDDLLPVEEYFSSVDCVFSNVGDSVDVFEDCFSLMDNSLDTLVCIVSLDALLVSFGESVSMSWYDLLLCDKYFSSFDALLSIFGNGVGVLLEDRLSFLEHFLDT